MKTRDEWRRTLTAEQFDVLREEGTERPFTSPLNHEKRKGTFVCVGCAAPLFMSDTKFDSGTGWPSFWAPIPGALATKVDYKLVYPRTEYHCRRCEGHQGHVFDDGPKADRPALLQQRHRAPLHPSVGASAGDLVAQVALKQAARPSAPRPPW